MVDVFKDTDETSIWVYFSEQPASVSMQRASTELNNLLIFIAL